MSFLDLVLDTVLLQGRDVNTAGPCSLCGLPI